MKSPCRAKTPTLGDGASSALCFLLLVGNSDPVKCVTTNLGLLSIPLQEYP
jgi:hypothetical protein